MTAHRPEVSSPRSSRTRGKSSQESTPAVDRDQPVLRRSEPSSRTFLIGEQPNPWDLLQPQDKMSRHRCRLVIIIMILYLIGRRSNRYSHYCEVRTISSSFIEGVWRVVSEDFPYSRMNEGIFPADCPTYPLFSNHSAYVFTLLFGLWILFDKVM